MRTNPLFTGEAPTDASATVTQFKIAARGKEDRHAATLAAIDGEVRRSQGEWRRTLDAVKETLATLERTCESAVETQAARLGQRNLALDGPRLDRRSLELQTATRRAPAGH